MRVYKARNYGVETGKFCERELEALLEAVANDGEEKVIEDVSACPICFSAETRQNA